MNRAWICTLALAGGIATSSEANGFTLDGEVYHPNAPIVWAATNAFPHSLMVYRIVPQKLSQSVISNAMAIGAFKPINLIADANKNVLHFQDSRDKTRMTKYLMIDPAAGSMRYFDNHARSSPVAGVPTFEEVDRLSADYFSLASHRRERPSMILRFCEGIKQPPAD